MVIFFQVFDHPKSIISVSHSISEEFLTNIPTYEFIINDQFKLQSIVEEFKIFKFLYII